MKISMSAVLYTLFALSTTGNAIKLQSRPKFEDGNMILKVPAKVINPPQLLQVLTQKLSRDQFHVKVRTHFAHSPY